MRKNYSGKFKVKVAVEVIKEQNTIAELASKYEVHRSILTIWKREALEGLPNIFATAQKARKKSHDTQNLIEDLYKPIGQLTVEDDWLKNMRESVADRWLLVDKSHPEISITRQCKLLQISIGALYYKPKPVDYKCSGLPFGSQHSISVETIAD